MGIFRTDMNMLTTLEIVERNMPSILMHSNWNSLDVDYHPPHVQRVWTEWNGIRVMLHRFPESCKASDALYHPHPWPSAMRVIEGWYTQEIGNEIFIKGPFQPEPQTVATVMMKADSCYEMTNPKGWHKVIPGRETFTLMVVGPLYPRDEMSFGNEKPKKKLGALSDDIVDMIINKFKDYYIPA